MSPLNPISTSASSVQSRSFTSLGEEQREPAKVSVSKETNNTPDCDLGHQTPQVDSRRRIHFGLAAANNVQGRGGSNAVATAKYELWNIVPKNLFEQFQRAANIWFLIVSICQMLPLDLSPTSKYATLVPLAFVLSITFCKDAYEDYGRRRDDSRVNNERCNAVDPKVVHASKLHEMRWKDVAVGMYLQLGRDEKVPADMVLIACSNEDGVAYVDTAQLDGETSLKPKFVLEETTRVSTSRELLALEGHLDAELPNQLVQSFHGTLHLRGYPRAVPLDIKNLLLRGSTLRNTAWVYGLVVYTGYDTKLVQNLKKTPSKRSRVEVTSNYLLIIVFTFLCFCAIFAATLRAIMLREGSDSARNLAWVWPEKDPLRDNSYLAFITFMIGYNNLIPISLYVTTDLVRSFQALLMEWDRNMYHHETDSGCRVKNSSLNENLGQVEFVLTDKTGTLTENHMQFKACAVQNRVYGCWDEESGAKDDVVRVPPAAVCKPLAGAPLRKAKEAGEAHKKVEIEQEEAELLDHFFMCLATCHTAIVEKSMRKVKPPSQRDQQQRRTFESGSLKTSYLSSESTDADMQNLLSGGSEGAEVSREAEEAEFRSSSPDEEALLAAARDYGFFFRRKSASRLTINVRGKDVFFNVLICNEFSSDRKRMSVLVRRSDELGPEVSSGSNTQCPTRDSTSGPVRSKSFPLDPVSDNATQTEQPSLNEQPSIGLSAESGPLTQTDSRNEHPVVLYVKGADNVMLERISKKDAGHLGITRKRLEQFSKEGLRTLVCAKRELTTAEAEKFCWKMQEAKTAFLNRNLMVEKVADEMERDLDILGVTAIEDRIQRGVPETVNMLLRAGVKVWMLTGDNMETAFNVGVACKLIDPAMRKYKLEPGFGGLVDTDPSSVQQMLAAFYNHISRELKAERKPGDFKYCLALHGKVLYTILDEAQATLRQLFLQIACSSSAVIACRLAPAQKAALVQLVRNGIAGSPLTLAIGDGGNDVSMIQEAHVGVGLLGVEGRQAANAADYVIGQFRFLQSLLFVHGRWNLRRIGLVIGYSFCKNFLLVCPLVHFGRYSGFSGTTLYESYLLSTFNLVFTSLPIVSVGVLDTDVTASMALLVPSLYQMGIQQRYFNAHMLLGWMLRGVIHAELTMVVMWVCFSGSLATSEVPGGLVPDYFTMGSWAYWTCVVVANLILMLHAKAWMDWQVLMVLGSILMFLLCLALYSDGNFILASTFQVNMVGVATALFGHMRSWMGLLFVAATSVFGESALSLLKKELAPDPSDVLQEIQTGLVTGKACSGATQEQRQAEAIEYLKTLPPSMPRVMRPKPEGRVSLRPFPAHCERRKWPQATVLPDAHSVVPVESDPTDFKGERHVHDNSAIIILPASYKEWLWKKLRDIVNTVYRMQWSEMAVGELCCTLECDRAGMSGYFKSPSLSNSTAPFRSDRHADESPTLQGSPTDLAKQGTSSSFAMRDRDNRDPSLLAEPASPTSPTSPTSPRSHSIASQITSDSKEVIKDLMYSIVTLRFFSVSQERDFSRFLTRQAIQLFGKSLLASFFVLFLFNLFSLAAKPGSDTVVRIVICVGVVPCCLATRCWLRTGACDRHAEPLITTFVIAIIVAKHIYDIVTHNSGILLNSYLPLFIFAGTLIRFPFAVLVLLSHLLGILVHYWLLAESVVVVYATDATEMVLQRPSEEYWVLMLGIAALATYYCYQLEKLMRRDFFVLDSIWKAKHQALEILKNMFPEGVVEHVVAQIGQDQRNKEGATGTPAARALREDRGIITIIFCDICDFDGLVEILLPHELVQLLDMIWMMFDHICDMHGVVKIETVSKTYMAAAMPEDPSLATTKRQATDASNAVLTAIGMLEHVSRRFTGTGKVTKVSVRIGIHTGRAISGVVGSQKPQFALFGDTVNTASRMQSTGKRNCLHISGATHELIAEDQRFEWETRQTQVKGKGDMTTYLLKRHRLPGHRHGSKVPRQRSSTSPPMQVPTQTPSLTTLDILPGCNRIAEGSDEATQHNVSNDSSGKQGVDSTAADTVTSSLPEGPRVATLDRLEQRGKAMAYFRQVSVSSSWGVGGSSRLSGWRRFLPGLGNCLIYLLEKLACNNHHARRLSKVGGSPMKPQWVSFVSFLVTFAIENLALIHAMQEVGMVELLLLRWAYVAFSLLVAFLLYRIGKRQKWGTKRTEGLAFCDLIALTVFAGFACSFIANMAVSRDPQTEVENWTVFEGFFYVMVLLHFCRLHPQGLVPVSLCVLVILTIILWVWSRDEGMLPECAAYTVFVCVTHWIAMAGDPRWAFSEQKAMCEDHERVSGLLDSMLPREVLSEMKSGSLSLAYQYENMTLLFADIVGFTRYCSECTAEQAVNLVTRLFADFDEHAVQLGVYKVCTIGDAYVAVNEPQTAAADKFADCESVYRMGKFVLQCIGRVRAELQHNDLDMRIGLHYGKFVGGVIGTKRVRFDIWGEDVLIGNNVESHGHAGCICVSEAAKEVLECTTLMPLTFTFNVDIELKNGRKVSTYICRPRTESSELEPAQHAFSPL